jgi:phosphate-selective porin OprO and OprP
VKTTLTTIVTLLGLVYFATNVQAQAQTPASQPISTTSVSGPTQSALSDSPEADPIQPSVSESRSTDPASFRRDGFWLSTNDGSTHLQVHGYVQADNRMFSSNMHGEELDAFLFRRIRPLFEGTLFNNVDFRFMPDFGQNNPQIQEAFLELKTLPFAKLRVGKFKEPIGLEVLRQDRDLTFVERSLASDLAPLRYIGAQLSGSVLSNSITYEGGYFDGSSDGSNAVFTQWTHGNEAAARAFFRPFAKTSINVMKDFGIGIGGSAGDQHGTIAGLKTIGQNTFFKYSSSTVADGQHNRLAPQAYYYAGPFGLMGEYVISSQEVLNKGLTGRIRNEAWQVQGSVLLTGEKNGYTGVHARNAFEPGRGFDHFGALELAFRYSQVRIDGDAFTHFASASTAAQFAGETGIGFNWYLTRYVKLQTDYEHTGFRMAPGSTTPLHSENLLLSQIQLAF